MLFDEFVDESLTMCRVNLVKSSPLGSTFCSSQLGDLFPIEHQLTRRRITPWKKQHKQTDAKNIPTVGNTEGCYWVSSFSNEPHCCVTFLQPFFQKVLPARRRACASLSRISSCFFGCQALFFFFFLSASWNIYTNYKQSSSTFYCKHAHTLERCDS